MYEHRSAPLLPLRGFIIRLIGHVAIALGAIVGSLCLGIFGYHQFENLSWLDSLLNASMILGGMGPIHIPLTPGGKLFASFYALFSGVIFLVVVGIMIAPVAHRLLHRLHLETEK